jgi:hypothetical protein
LYLDWSTVLEVSGLGCLAPQWIPELERIEPGDQLQQVLLQKGLDTELSFLARAWDPLAFIRQVLILESVLRIRIRIHRMHMFLGLLHPDPLVRCMDPDPDTSIIMQK